MPQGDRPQRVRRPVHHAEDPQPDALTQQAGDDHHDEHVKGQRAQALPQRSVRAEEWHNEVDESQLRVRVEEQQPHVQRHQQGSGQRGEPVDIGDSEPRQDEQRTARPGGDPQRHRDSQKTERRDAGAAPQGPERLAGHEPRERVTRGVKLGELLPTDGAWLVRMGKAGWDAGACVCCTGACCTAVFGAGVYRGVVVSTGACVTGSGVYVGAGSGAGGGGGGGGAGTSVDGLTSGTGGPYTTGLAPGSSVMGSAAGDSAGAGRRVSA
ncbi:hypothetical protein MHPYR_230085 [uncultured Mycobacterium sp.]|uniref:Uncharacterized protein n=1 Tax=uncultured Mycobacterium sp. TaxID=171292 RepID=A0A1Y5P9Z0_9MYCO|nr:hypothetical protein MHPYR_230085 [uncultured Mycobacterium sp.]